MKKRLVAVNPYAEEASALTIEERQAFMRLTSSIIDEMPDCASKWAVALALGTANTAGRTLDEMASLAGVSENALLKAAAKFCATHHLHASPALAAHYHARMAGNLKAIEAA